MAEQRRAKKVNVNGVNGVQTGEDDGADREGELAKAEREAQDVEDEEEEEGEDYDPGSEGESEGSGTGSEEDGADGGGGEGDLVEEELGSEAEQLEE